MRPEGGAPGAAAPRSRGARRRVGEARRRRCIRSKVHRRMWNLPAPRADVIARLRRRAPGRRGRQHSLLSAKYRVVTRPDSPTPVLQGEPPPNAEADTRRPRGSATSWNADRMNAPPVSRPRKPPTPLPRGDPTVRGRVVDCRGLGGRRQPRPPCWRAPGAETLCIGLVTHSRPHAVWRPGRRQHAWSAAVSAPKYAPGRSCVNKLATCWRVYAVRRRGSFAINISQSAGDVTRSCERGITTRRR